MDKTTFRLFQARIDAGAVPCTIEGWHRYNRTLGICYTAGGTDLNGWLVDSETPLPFPIPRRPGFSPAAIRAPR